MKERARNLIVGLTVLIALGLLGAMILIFTGVPGILQRGYPVHMQFNATAGVEPGAIVFFSGINIGKITRIHFTEGDMRKGVTITARIRHNVRLPGNVRAYISTLGLVGGPYLELKADGPERTHPLTGKVLEYLPKDGRIIVEGKLRGTSMIPEELVDSLKNLGELTKNLNAFLAPPASQPTQPEEETVTSPASQPAAQGFLVKFSKALDSLNAALDEENRANLKTSLAHLSETTKEAKDAMKAMKEFAINANDKVDDISDKLVEDAERMAELMASINRIVTKIDSGEGSAGRFLNDPQLYSNLVDATSEMTKLMEEFRQMVKDWKKDGIEVKLK